MSDLLATYIPEAASEGVDLYSDDPGKDAVSLDVFDEVYEPDGKAPQEDAVSTPITRRVPSSRSAKSKVLMLAPGFGDYWA